jgi:hypothetical protein
MQEGGREGLHPVADMAGGGDFAAPHRGGPRNPGPLRAFSFRADREGCTPFFSGTRPKPDSASVRPRSGGSPRSAFRRALPPEPHQCRPGRWYLVGGSRRGIEAICKLQEPDPHDPGSPAQTRIPSPPAPARLV